jgi:Tfp pilus assembly protein PilF
VQTVAQLVTDRSPRRPRPDQPRSHRVEVALDLALGYVTAGHARLASSADTAVENSPQPTRVVSNAATPAAVSS